MSEILDEALEVTIEEEQEKSNSIKVANVDDLLTEYNAYRTTDATNSASTAQQYTIGSLKDLNTLIADAVIKVEEYISQGTPQSMMEKTTSKALAVIDPNNKWLGKWASKAKDDAKKEDIKAKSVDQVIGEIKLTMTTQRDNVEKAAYRAFEDKERLSANLAAYLDIRKRAEAFLANSEPGSKDEFTTKRLIGMITGTLHTIESSIKDIETLITNAGILIQDINNDLPTIEASLQERLGIKGFQQEVSDLMHMKNVVKTMVNDIDDVTTASIQNTALETMVLLKDTGVDVERIKQKNIRDAAYHKKMTKAIQDVKTTADRQFEEVQQLALEHKANLDKNTQAFIENYAEGFSNGKTQNN